MLTYEFGLTQDQLVDFFKKQSRKAGKMLLVLSIIFTVALVLCVALYFLVDSIDFSSAVIVLLFLTVFGWIAYSAISKSAPKNAETYFKYHNVDGVVTFVYELKETEFVVMQPAIGNVSHYKYDMIVKVSNLDGYAVVTLAANQMLPILANETTANLISTLQSCVKTK